MTEPTKSVFDAALLLETTSSEVIENRSDLPGLTKEQSFRRNELVMDSCLGNLKILVNKGQEKAASDWIEAQNGRVISLGPQVVVANVPAIRTKKLESQKFARRIEAPRLLYRCLDEARGSVTRLDFSLENHSLTGEGVVIGVIDSGVDWYHPDFRNSDDPSQTRIEFFLQATRPAASQESIFKSFGRDEINIALRNPEAHQEVGDPHGHGTHCASIAAGNGVASQDRFRGVAPQATLMAVQSEPLLDSHVIRGIREIFQQAGDRPAVVNLSLGSQLGPHDGTSALENAIAQESGPGRIVVVAAGNAGDRTSHWQGQLVENESLEIPFITDGNTQWVDIWISRDDEVDVTIESPDGVVHQPDGQMMTTVFGRHQAIFAEDPVNRDHNLMLLLFDQSAGQKWKVRLKPRSVIHGEIHAWTGTQEGGRHATFPTGDDEFSIGIPATEERAISVASFVSKTAIGAHPDAQASTALSQGEISSFSSKGPTRYGYMKPDIAAPGQYVTAALASGSEMATSSKYAQRVDQSGKYVTIQGTSMAAPFVSGVVALLLEREPTLTPEEIKQRFRITARRDKDTSKVWNPSFGHGKIDVEALLAYGYT